MKKSLIRWLLSFFAFILISILVVYLKKHTNYFSSNKSNLSPIQKQTLKKMWLHNLDDAKKEALLKKVPILIEFRADWCAPCQILENDLFLTEQFSDFILKKKIILVSIDLTFDNESNQEIADSFNVSGLPTFVILDAIKYKEVNRIEGFTSIPSFMSELNQIFK